MEENLEGILIVDQNNETQATLRKKVANMGVRKNDIYTAGSLSDATKVLKERNISVLYVAAYNESDLEKIKEIAMRTSGTAVLVEAKYKPDGEYFEGYCPHGMVVGHDWVSGATLKVMRDDAAEYAKDPTKMKEIFQSTKKYVDLYNSGQFGEYSLALSEAAQRKANLEAAILKLPPEAPIAY